METVAKYQKLLEYAGHYLGCPIVIVEGEHQTSAYLEGIDGHLGKLIAERVSWYPNNIRLLLRPVKTMTKEELNTFSELPHSHAWHWMCQQHFDVFGLIDAGLALPLNPEKTPI